MKGIDIKSGDTISRKTFQQLYHMYYNAMCAFSYKYLKDTQMVEDLVQEAFVSFWEKNSGFDHLNAVKSYLYTAVRNKCLNLLKHNEVKIKNEHEIIRVLEDEFLFDEHVVEEETFNLLYTEIKLLPDSAKNIMLLALNGLKNPEIAEELNISVNTVKTQKKIAYSKLKAKLKPPECLLLLTF
ncbi:MAG: RNA polymerase sigma-70 factor [Salinivirgaceae bacterium]|nr:MAG: RNA polymerase sigma-70 factor [Salinivirgaceae bacterium]